MPDISREQLDAYLDDTLDPAEAATVEKALRESEELRDLLLRVMQERDRGEHSVGGVWRRHRLTCPTREQLGSYLLEALDPDFQDYIKFHLETIGCVYCRANLADLQKQQNESAEEAQQRRRKLLKASAPHLPGRSKKS